MTKESLENGIARLLKKRAELPPFSEEQAEVSGRLEKLYSLKYTMLEQESARS